MKYLNKPAIPVMGFSLGSWRFSIARLGFDSAELTRRYDKLATRWCRLTTQLGLPAAYMKLFGAFWDTQPGGTSTTPLVRT